MNKKTAYLLCFLSGFFAFGMAGAQQAKWHPERNVEIVIPSGAGGSNDAGARMLQQIFQKHSIVGRPVIAVNKPGGAGTIGLTYLSQFPGDAHFLLNGAINVLTNHIIGRSKLHYSAFTAVALLHNEYLVTVVKADSKLTSGREMLDRLKEDPTSLSMAIGAAPGGTAHLAMALVAKANGIDARKLKTVVFKSFGDAVTAVMGGHVDAAFVLPGPALRGLESGQLRIIGITSRLRLRGNLANVPTWKEQGGDVEFSASRFILGAPGLTSAQLAYWDAAFAKLVATDEWRKALESDHLVGNYLRSVDAARYLEKQEVQLKGALVDTGLAK